MDTKRLRELAEAALLDSWPVNTDAYREASDPDAIINLLDRLEAAEHKLRHATMAADAEARRVDELTMLLKARREG